MNHLVLRVLSLRYSSWSIRPWLLLTHAGATFETSTASASLERQTLAANGAPAPQISPAELDRRRAQGSITGLFPVLEIDGSPVHESLAIAEWVADAFPSARLWPNDTLQRAQARAVCAEMIAGFRNIRSEMSCHLFGRVPHFEPSPACRTEIDRVFEVFRSALAKSGGPFLFGHFTIADAMYYPVRTRFRTYGIDIPRDLAAYIDALDGLPAVQSLVQMARSAPLLPVYDAYLLELGGDPNAGLS